MVVARPGYDVPRVLGDMRAAMNGKAETASGVFCNAGGAHSVRYRRTRVRNECTAREPYAETRLFSMRQVAEPLRSYDGPRNRFQSPRVCGSDLCSTCHNFAP